MRGRLPDQRELANIVYRSSFGFRGVPHTTESSDLIRSSRWATAVVVLNRARQGISWGTDAGTEPHDPISRTSLEQAGNARAYQECFDVAEAALRVHDTNLPLNAAMLLRGAQYYRHNDHPSYRRWEGVDGDLVFSYGPMGDFAGRSFWLGVYVNPRQVERAMEREAEPAVAG